MEFPNVYYARNPKLKWNQALASLEQRPHVASHNSHCPVCLDPVYIALGCRHGYCIDCLSRCIESGHKTCSLCRQTVNYDTLRLC